MARRQGVAPKPSTGSLAMQPADYDRARRTLGRRDPVLAAIIRRVGACGLADREHAHGLQAMVESIVWQQLSGKAAATIYGRFRALFPEARFPEAAAVLAVPPEALRGAGLSTRKAAYIRDLCERVAAGTLDLEGLATVQDEAVIETLTEIKGIGRWTAEMFLMFRLHRPDVLPVGDLGIVKAMQRAYGLRKPPAPDRMLAIGRPWRPYRSVASWYLWASLRPEPG